MERRYFQLAQGYLHVDAKGLILTRSGNWQEAEAATERSRKQAPGQAGRCVIGIVIIVIGGLFLLFGRMSHASDDSSTIIALGLTAFGIYSLYRSLRHEFSPVFRIPFARMLSVEGAEGQLTVRFLNGDLKEEQLALTVPIEAVPVVLEAYHLART
jgi:hypothetical protein